MSAVKKTKHIRVTRLAHQEILALSEAYRVSIPDLMDLAVRSLAKEIKATGQLRIDPVVPPEVAPRGQRRAPAKQNNGDCGDKADETEDGRVRHSHARKAA